MKRALSTVYSRASAKISRTTRLIHFQEMEELHFASWILLNNDPSYPPTVVLETSYDGDLESHLDELIEHGQAGLDAVYRMCEGYPSGGSARCGSSQKLLEGTFSSLAAIFPGFTG